MEIVKNLIRNRDFKLIPTCFWIIIGVLWITPALSQSGNEKKMNVDLASQADVAGQNVKNLSDLNVSTKSNIPDGSSASGGTNGPGDPTYTIQAVAGVNGTINPDGIITVSEGADQTFLIAPDEGCSTDSVIVDGVNVGAVSGYTFYAITANHRLRAFFSVTRFTIGATAHQGGSIVPQGIVSVNYGSDQEFVITPLPGYHIDSVVVDGTNLGPATGYTFVSVTANHSIDSYFSMNSYIIEATATQGGSISPSGSVPASHGTNRSFIISPSPYHHLDSLVVDGVNQDVQTAYTFINVTANHTISAFFSIDRFVITAAASGNGSIVPAGAISVAYGASQSFSMTPDSGYHLDSVIVDGTNLGTPATYTFENVDAPHSITPHFSINIYTITASSGPGGSISPSGGIQVVHGSSQSFAIAPDPGFHVDSVLIDGANTGAITSYTFTGVTTGHTIEAHFSIDLFTIIATGGTHGTITPSGTIVIPRGGSRLFTITPDAGYHVAHVYVDGLDQGAITTYAFSNVSAPHTIEADFAIDVYTISSSTSGGGVITPSGSVQVDHGATRTFTLTPDPGYHIDSLVVDAVNQGVLSAYTFANVNANHAIVGYFSINRYTVTAGSGAGGSITPSGLMTVNHGEDVSFTCTADPGHHVDSVVVDGVNLGALSNHTISGISADHVIRGYFSINMYTIMATTGGGGSIVPSGPVAVAYGAGQSFTFNPDAGYHVVSLVVDGVPQGTQASYSFTNVAANHSIEVYFAINGYVITSSAGPGGTIDPAGIVPVNHGDSESFTMDANDGYHIDSVLVDGVTVGTPATYTFDNVTTSHTISVYFSLDLFTITASSGSGGSISPSGDVVVVYDGTQAFTITPSIGHHIDSVVTDGVNRGPLTSFTFMNILDDHTIEAYFSPDIFTISASAGNGGSISPSGDVEVLYGSSEVFDIAPDDGFHISRVDVDGVPVGTPATYTFSNISASHVIAAVFSPDSVVILAAATAGGAIAPTGSVAVIVGGSQEFSILADAGFHTDSVVVDGLDEGAIDSYEFTDVQRDHSITAYFSVDLNGFPALDAISPENCVVGEDSIALDISGSGFLPVSGVRFNGQILPTTFEDSTSLTVMLLRSDLDTAGIFPVEVVNPAPGGGVSGSKIFTVLRQREGVGSVAGTVYVDMNGSGAYEIGDAGQPDWTVSILTDGAELESFTTGSDGRFAFDSLDEGSYVVQLEPEDGWELTQPPTPGAYTITVDSVNRVFTSYNFGAFEFGSISGLVYRDVNGNATMDIDEAGMPGVRVEASSGMLVHSAITDEEGEFMISDVGHGSYSVQEVVPSQYVCLQGQTGYAMNFTSGAMVQAMIFGNASAWDTVKFRTVTMDDWAEAVDAKGKLKPIRKKSDKVEFSFPVVSDGSGSLSLEFNMPVEGVVSLSADGSGMLQTVEGKKISGLAVSVQAGDTIWVNGVGQRGKELKARFAWGRTRKITVSHYAMNVLRYPLPNWHNVGDELFKRKAFGAGLSVGATVFPNGGGTVVHRSYRDVLKSLTNRGEVHSGPARCIDFYNSGKVIQSRLQNLPWDKQDNELFAQQLILKLNITASDQHYFQPGFGDLLYDNSAVDADDPFNNQSIRFIATRVDSFLGCLLPRNGVPGDLFLEVVSSINEAFSGEIDTISFAGELMFTGTRSLGQAQMFAPSPGPIPVYTPPAPFVAEPIPTAYRLHQNYPNPFNPSTTIAFEIPGPSIVSLRVYNLIGQEVSVVIDREEMEEGMQEVEFDASGLPSGIYFYRLEAAPFTEGDGSLQSHKTIDSRKMVLIK